MTQNFEDARVAASNQLLKVSRPSWILEPVAEGSGKDMGNVSEDNIIESHRKRKKSRKSAEMSELESTGLSDHGLHRIENPKKSSPDSDSNLKSGNVLATRTKRTKTKIAFPELQDASPPENQSEGFQVRLLSENENQDLVTCLSDNSAAISSIVVQTNHNLHSIGTSASHHSEDSVNTKSSFTTNQFSFPSPDILDTEDPAPNSRFSMHHLDTEDSDSPLSDLDSDAFDTDVLSKNQSSSPKYVLKIPTSQKKTIIRSTKPESTQEPSNKASGERAATRRLSTTVIVSTTQTLEITSDSSDSIHLGSDGYPLRTIN